MQRRFSPVFVLLLALVAGIGVQPFNHLFPSVPDAHAASVSILLNGSISGWNATTNKNPMIAVTQGDQVNLSLKSTDLNVHQFLLDGDNDGAADTADCPSTNDPCSALFSTSTGILYRFIVNLPPGIYTYYCSIHPTLMNGTFLVSSTLGGIPLSADKPALTTPYILFAALIVTLVFTVVYSTKSNRKEKRLP
ncbi:MAG TPA: hypothetical protein VFV92_16925 [Candidatus Bathyarchaeia archaeon]|nr:hypothetical protein [Candidatus Bathyarchaeia archaeon]